MNDTVYHQVHSARGRMILVGVLGLGSALVFFAASVSWYIVLSWSFVILALLWTLKVISRAGVQVTDEEIRLWIGLETWAYLLEEIDHVRVSGQRGGDDYFTIYFRDGDTRSLPPGALPSSEEFTLALTEQGIRVRRVG